MIEISIDRRMIRPPTSRWIRVALGCALALALLWTAWGGAQTASAEPPWPQPPAGTRVQLPALSSIGNQATSQTLIQVQNVGNDFTRAIVLLWGEAGACGPQAAGPFKVECSGLIKPGATWMFGQRQMPAGAQSGIVYTFPEKDVQVNGQTVNVADEFCTRLFSEVVLKANKYRQFDLAFRQGDKFFDLPTDEGQPVAVDVVRVGPGTPSPDLSVSGSYAGIPGPETGNYDPVYGGFAYYAPLVYANAGGLTSYLSIQNSGLDCTGVELWFQGQNDCLRPQVCEVITLAPGETSQFNVSDCVGPSFVGSVWIRTSQPAGVVVDHIGQDVLMTDKGLAAENAITQPGSEVLFGPLIYREFQGWETSIAVQNMSSTRFATVKAYFYDESGNVITTLVDYVCPRGVQTFFLPVINGLPGRYVGAVRVESLSTFRQGEYVPIAGVAHLKKYTDPTASQAQEAVSYNLFSEPQSFDWHGGPGQGLIGVPSVLKQGRGLSTELAIQNVNPNPGFTDFAVYIYDTNGLIDVVCESLSAYNVEYINFNSWGILNPGFVGSVVISGIFTNQEPGGFGLTAVGVQRVQSILQFNAPGDESSGHEAFPIMTEDFDFEGPNAPACPGVAEDQCSVVFSGTVWDDDNGDNVVDVTDRDGAIDPGEPRTSSALLEFFHDADNDGRKDSGEQTLGNATTAADGRYTIVLQQPDGGAGAPGLTTNWAVQITLPDGRQDVQSIGQQACGGPFQINIEVPFDQYTIEGFAVDDTDGDGDADPGEARVSGLTIVLQGDTDKDSVLDDTVATTTTDDQGRFQFKDVEEFQGLCTSGAGGVGTANCATNATQNRQFRLKAQMTNAAGNTVTFMTPNFNLGFNYDGSVMFGANPERPNFITNGDPSTGVAESWNEPVPGGAAQPVDGPNVD